MADLQIPKEHREALTELLRLPEVTIDNFLFSLSELKLSVQGDSLTGSLASGLKGIGISDPEITANVIIALYATFSSRFASKAEIFEFVRDVVSTLEDALVGEGERAQAERTLTKLVSYERLATALKASRLLTDQERLFSSARILTDARPVFGDDPTAPLGVVINQTLRITFLQDDRSIDFYVALDSQDLANLRDVVDRAEKKAAGLKAIFESANIPIIES